MKKLKQLLFIGLISFTTSTAFSQVSAKNHWEKYDTSDGLISNNIQEVLIQDSSNIWLATDSGLTHFDGTTFTNHRPSANLPVSDDVSNLVFAQGKLWMKNSIGGSVISSASLLSFDGTTFSQFSAVRNIVATKTDTLWMTKGSGGVSKYDGTTFTDYPAIPAFKVVADSADRIYAAYVVGAASVDSVSLYENGVWSNPLQVGFSSQTTPGIMEFKLAKSGELLMFPQNTNYYYEIDYPLTFTRKRLVINGVSHSANVNVARGSLEKSEGKLWGITGYQGILAVSGTDSLVDVHFADDLNVSSNDVDVESGIVAIATNFSGLYLAKSTIEPISIEQTVLDVNHLKTGVRINDPLFTDVHSGTANLEFPKNSGNYGVFSSNFIVAAKKLNQSNYSVYPLRGFATSFISGPINNTAGLSDQYILKLTKQEIVNHQANFAQPNYSVPSSIKDWPAYGDSTLGMSADLAPFFDSNSNGCYDPENGDYPIIKGDEAIYWINHPADKSLELEYHWMMYGYNSIDTALSQTLFVDYTIVNRANVAYDSVKVGLYLDADVGAAADDYVGCDSLNDIMYAYNGVLNDGGQAGSPGYGNRTPAVGVKFVSDPMETMIYYNIGFALNGDPNTGQDWLNYMNAKWKNGQSVKYGGNGLNSSGVSTAPTTHMFTGDPYALTGWTELTTGDTQGQGQNPSGDRRTFGSMPYFSLQPNERKTIEIAVGFGRTVDTVSQVGQNVSELIRVLNSASAFNSGVATPTLTFASTDSCSAVSVQEIIGNHSSSLSVFPVPSSGELTIQSEERITLLEVYDMKGAKVISLPMNQKQLKLSLEGYEDGFYLVRVQLEDNRWLMKKIVKM